MRIEKREKKQEDIIEVQSPVRIAQGDHDVLLEKGDRFVVVSESDVTLIPRILQDYQRTAASAKKRGGYVEINHRYGTVAVQRGDGSEEYFFQGDEADDLLNEVPSNISEEDYILAVSQGW